MTRAAHPPDLAQIGERAFTEVLTTFLSLRAAPMNSSSENPADVSDQIAATVHLAGKGLSGTVQVWLPRPFVAQALKQLTGLDGAEGEPVQEDTAREITNMVAGRVAAQLAAQGYICSLGIPSVAHRSILPTSGEPGTDSGRTKLNCEGHTLWIEIRCCYKDS